MNVQMLSGTRMKKPTMKKTVPIQDAQGQLRECSARGADVEAPKSEPAEEQL